MWVCLNCSCSLCVLSKLHIRCVIPVATLVHVMEGLGSPWASQASLAVLSAGMDTVLMCGSAIFGLARTSGV